MTCPFSTEPGPGPRVLRMHVAPTQQLMVRFYENLWQKKMSKLDALREAQLWMLNNGRKWLATQPRGLASLKQNAPDDNDTRLPPYYWAAFQLSGDWR